MTRILADVTVAPPLQNPPWVRWAHTDSGVWPAIDFPGNRDQSAVPAYVVEVAVRGPGAPSWLILCATYAGLRGRGLM